MRQSILTALRTPNAEIIKEDALGGIVIISLIGPAVGRRGLERKLMPVSLAGLAGFERAHSQGNITGHESAHGIAYAPIHVNQTLQKLGVEDYIKQWLEVKPPDVALVLTTVTYMHDEIVNGKKIRGQRLQQIVYKVEATHIKTEASKLIFEGWIGVDDNRINPRSWCGVGFHYDYGVF
jgi:hypothetical protein